MSDGLTPLTPAQTAYYESQAAHDGYIHGVALDVDKLGGALLSMPQDVTISSELGIMSYKDKGLKGWIGRIGAKLLNIAFSQDHSAKATAADYFRAMHAAAILKNSGLIQPNANQ